tara:strand:+ start:4396 stop:5055 length:660 start_codon:yes stop_codon:yes gene_type:complete
MRGRLITVCGLIGSGKSTFTSDLADLINAVPLSEPAGDDRNPYLSLYYEDRERWAFTMQVHLLHHRDSVHQRALEEIHSGRDVVMDSSVWQDMAYADMLFQSGVMSENEYETYRYLARLVDRKSILPDVCVYLEVPVFECFQRIQQRMELNTDRTCESSIELDYLRNLELSIKRNIEKIPHKVFFPWGDYLPSKDERVHRIRNLWCLTDDLKAHIRLKN